jgi:hypothetical protein
MIKNLSAFVSILILYSCGSGEKVGEDSLRGEVAFEFLDSVVVESMAELYLADKDENTGRLLFNDWFMTELLLTDLKGEEISRFGLSGEGPNQVQNPTEVAFWKNGLVGKEMSEEGKLSFFNADLEKTGKSPALAKALYVLTIPNMGRSFSLVEKEGETFFVGSDKNALDPQLMTPEGQDGSFYSKTETGYIYVPGSEELHRFNLYPETWEPRKEQRWVGMASPFVQVSKVDQVVAVLPMYGNQMFYYELNGKSISPIAEIPLFHSDRNGNISFDVKKDSWVLYPFFTSLSSGGNYFLVEFHTAFPRDLYESFRAKDEEFQMDPEYREAIEKHRRAKYILTDANGNQGAIAELPIPGKIHLLDADDVIYIKPTSEMELDYNVFYRYQISLK